LRSAGPGSHFAFETENELHLAIGISVTAVTIGSRLPTEATAKTAEQPLWCCIEWRRTRCDSEHGESAFAHCEAERRSMRFTHPATVANSERRLSILFIRSTRLAVSRAFWRAIRRAVLSLGRVPAQSGCETIDMNDRLSS
jgi:hypothetical protein